MPSLVTLPFNQCHHTRGLAESGGFLKSRSKASPEVCPLATPARPMSQASAKIRIITLRVSVILITPLFTALQTRGEAGSVDFALLAGCLAQSQSVVLSGAG